VPSQLAFTTSPRDSRRRPAGALHRAAEERGQALVEFALVLPLLLVLVFGITNFGLALNSASDQTQVASMIARYAAVNENPGKALGKSLQQWGKEQAEKSVLSEGTLKAKPEVCISFPDGAAIAKPVKVEFKTQKNLLPFANKLNLTWVKVTIAQTVVMRLEAPPSEFGSGCV
jgi:Flp pilus assembly protein TadG